VSMYSKIDWISFTMPILPIGEGREDIQFDRVTHQLRMEDPDLAGWLGMGDDWKLGGGRAPYKHSARSAGSLVSIYWGETLTTVLFEFSGRACYWLDSIGIQEHVLSQWKDRITRLDVCSDIETDCLPHEFVEAGVSATFRSKGRFDSDTGQTIYIGSQKSERFARVYKYAPPHPRAGLLRVEHVLRRDAAKMVLEAILAAGLAYAVQSLGMTFGWTHSAWNPEDVQAEPLTMARVERSLGGTEMWLIKQAAPAFRRLIDEAVIVDPVVWLTRYFLENLDDLDITVVISE